MLQLVDSQVFLLPRSWESTLDAGYFFFKMGWVNKAGGWFNMAIAQN